MENRHVWILKYIAATLHSPLSYKIDVMIGR